MKKRLLGVFLILLGCFMVFIYWNSTNITKNTQQTGENTIKDIISWEDNNYVYLNDDILVSLKEVFSNEDVIGYIEFEEAGISYPIVKSKDNKEYLKMDIYGNYSFAGSIFADVYNESDFSDLNTALYGHNMIDGSMFGNLEEYINKEGLKGTIKVYTKDRLLIYQCISYGYIQNSKESARMLISDNYDEFIKWLSSISSEYKLVEEQNEPKFITLVTCHYTGNSNVRFGVTCQLVEEKGYKLKEE